MTTWAVIPAKPLDAAKTRLSPALAPRERAALACGLFLHTVEAARACSVLAGVLVVSADPELRALASGAGAQTCADPLPSGSTLDKQRTEALAMTTRVYPPTPWLAGVWGEASPQAPPLGAGGEKTFSTRPSRWAAGARPRRAPTPRWSYRPTCAC